MSTASQSDPLAVLQERVTTLEKTLQDSTRRATILAIVVAMIGSGGVSELLHLRTNERLGRAEAALDEQKTKNDKVKHDVLRHEEAITDEKKEIEEIKHKLRELSEREDSRTRNRH